MSDPQMHDADAGGAAGEFVDAPVEEEPPPPPKPVVPLPALEDDHRRDAYGAPTSPKDRDIP